MQRASTATACARRPCPTCGRRGGDVLHEQRFEPLEGALFDGYDVTACAACGSVFADGLPEPAAFERYYAEMSKYEAPGADSEWDVRRLATTASVFARFVDDPRASVVEVGSATGLFLSALAERGYARAVGFDPSGACATTARERRGVDVRVGSLASMQASAADVLVAIGVVEHLLDPVPALGDALRALGPGCRLFLELPDADGFAGHANAPYQQLSVEHIGFYTQAAVTNLLAALGHRPSAWHRGAHEWQEGLFEPYLCVLSEPDATVRIEPESASRAALERYLASCAGAAAEVARRVERCLAGPPLYVWGTGTHTLRLLRETRLGEAPIRAFLDTNPRYQGRVLRERPILAPEAVEDDGSPILVSSYVYQHSIARQVRGMGLSNPLVTLYDR